MRLSGAVTRFAALLLIAVLHALFSGHAHASTPGAPPLARGVRAAPPAACRSLGHAQHAPLCHPEPTTPTSSPAARASMALRASAARSEASTAGRTPPLLRGSNPQRNSMGDVLAMEASATHGGAFSASFQRDALGLELERALPGGVRARWQRDAIGRPVRQEIWRGEQFHGAKQYTWDANDRLRRVIDAMSGPVEYTHDGFGNLASAAYADGRVDLRMPDAVGNLFRTKERTDRKYGPAGQLLEARDARGVTTYDYDPEGNLVKKVEPDGGTWTYEWNGAGMLTRVVRPNGHAVEFAYDALARRLSKTYRGKTTRWIWDGNVPLHEWVERSADAVDEDFSGTEREDDAVAAGEKALKALLAARPANGPPTHSDMNALSSAVSASEGTKDAPITWLFEPESFAPLAKIVGGERYGIVTDHLGTPTAMFDGAGREVWGADVDAYGDLRNLRGERGACPFRRPGQYEDVETGLYYNRFRHYSPSGQVYISHDPIGLAGGPQLLSHVADPLLFIDPYGLKSCSDVAKRGRKGTFYEAVRTADGDLLITSGPLSRKRAQARLRRMMESGDSTRGIYTVGKQEARDLATSAGRGRPVLHPAHPDPLTESTAGRFGHYHPAGDHGGHVWYGDPR